MAGACLVAGCTSYVPKPLDQPAIDAELTATRFEAVKLAAGKLQHPLLSPLVISGGDAFSPDELAVMTVIASPALRALRAQLGVVQAQLMQAGLLPNPQLAATLDRVDARGDPSLVNGSSVGVSWDISALLALADTKSAARATAAALDLSIAWQEWQAAEDTRLRAFRVLSLEERLPLLREIESDRSQAMEELRRAVEQRLRVATELTTATDAWRQARTERLTVEQQIRVDRAALRLSLGLSPAAALELRVTEDFTAVTAESADALLNGLEERRLDLAALKVGYASQEATLRAAVKAQFPKISISFARARDTSNVHTRSFGVTLDLPLFDHAQGQIAVARATRQQLFDEYVARVAEARSQVGQLLAEIATARQELTTIEATLPALEASARSFATARAEHIADAAADRDAQQALATRRVERSQFQQTLRELGVGLELATGRPLLNRRTTDSP